MHNKCPFFDTRWTFKILLEFKHRRIHIYVTLRQSIQLMKYYRLFFYNEWIPIFFFKVEPCTGHFCHGFFYVNWSKYICLFVQFVFFFILIFTITVRHQKKLQWHWIFKFFSYCHWIVFSNAHVYLKYIFKIVSGSCTCKNLRKVKYLGYCANRIFGMNRITQAYLSETRWLHFVKKLCIKQNRKVFF